MLNQATSGNTLLCSCRRSQESWRRRHCVRTNSQQTHPQQAQSRSCPDPCPDPTAVSLPRRCKICLGHALDMPCSPPMSHPHCTHVQVATHVQAATCSGHVRQNAVNAALQVAKLFPFFTACEAATFAIILGSEPRRFIACLN